MMSELGKTPIGMGIATLAQYAALSPVLKGMMDHAGVNKEEVATNLIGKAKDAIKAGVDEFTKAGQPDSNAPTA